MRSAVIRGKLSEVTYTPTSRGGDMNALVEMLHGLSVKWQREDLGTELRGEARRESRGNQITELIGKIINLTKNPRGDDGCEGICFHVF